MQQQEHAPLALGRLAIATIITTWLGACTGQPAIESGMNGGFNSKPHLRYEPLSEDGGVCECTGTGPNGPITVACGESACGSDYYVYSCSAAGWSWTGEPCPANDDAGDAGEAGDATCECSGTGPGGVPVTVSCGEIACGSDYMTYACSATGWLPTGEPCPATGDAGDAGDSDGLSCECSGTGPGGVPVTVSCGENACGSDYNLYYCSAAGWSWTGQPCPPNDDGGPGDAADLPPPCECSGTGPGGVPVVVSCGESACGSDYLMYTCSSAGWSYTGQACPADGGADADAADGGADADAADGGADADAADGPDATPSDTQPSTDVPPLPTARVLLMHMEQPEWNHTPGEVVDDSGLGNHGVAEGTATTFVDGKFGRAGAFIGAGAVTVADAPSLRASSALTIAAWIYPTAVSGVASQGIISKRAAYGTEAAYGMYLKLDGYLWVDIQSHDDRFASTSKFVNGSWYHVAVVFDGSLPQDERARVYINGALDKVAKETSASISPYTSPLTIGLLPGGGGYFLGLIDEAAIWTRALSAAEIAGLYNATGPM